MAKEDFCFTFYDGDAARDMAHMNRTERGCYMDIIISQRKFGRLTLDQVKKILSKDFDECFPAIELVLIKDEDNKLYIEWLDTSIVTKKKHSKKQKENIGKRWNKSGNTKLIPNDVLVIPLGNGNEYGNGIENENNEGGTGETQVFHVSHGNTMMDIDLLLQKVIHDVDGFVRVYVQQGIDRNKLEQWLENFNKWLLFTGCSKKLERDYRTHFSNWIKQQDLTIDATSYSPTNLKDGKNIRRIPAKEHSTSRGL